MRNHHQSKLVILGFLQTHASVRFTALQDSCEISLPAFLRHLNELLKAEYILKSDDKEYRITGKGQTAYMIMEKILSWEKALRELETK